MKRKTLLNVSIVFVLLLSLLLSCVAYSQTVSTPLLKAGLAYAQAQSSKTIDEEFRIDLRYSAGNNATENSKKLEEFFKKMHIKGRVVSDVSKYESSMQITLYYNNKELLKGSIYVNKEYVAYNFPQVYSKPLYVKLSDAYANMPVQIDVNKYIKLFDIQNNPQLQALLASYADVVLPKFASCAKLSNQKVELKFSNGKKEVCDEIIFEFNKNSSLDLLKAILTKAADDKATKEFVLNVAKTILEDSQAILNAQQLNKTTTLNIDEIMKQAEANYSQSIKEVVYQLDKMSPQIPPFTLQYRMMVDSKNNFKGERLYFYLKDSNNLKVMFDLKGVINSLNQPVNITKIDISKGVDISKLSDKDFETMMKNVENILKMAGISITK
ncbi:hypothetical protein Csac_2432 [Caldicellulosiruptor saccharolyticus DSM 8903]|uniref:Uncharacterized protein n=1 Tax=Caldicellulosiruptor saccharolyticus (strain ATCC 43494 / DSM 8903 / Tp8T 6331) TaxID=351627 RepID=A4XM74_CALS8|nr:hypothetical protein [Caldicellulosiruptor saccharolyticus]ABP68009.1 hypothetical protein Csac_2432 [Caldicellulosiruptor saccharolyticus DSM 8903]